MAALEMLNIMATSQPGRDGASSTTELNKKMEAMKLAYTDLYRAMATLVLPKCR